MAAVDANSNGRDSDDYEGERNMRTGLMNRIYLLFSLAFVMMLILPAAGFALEASPSETSSSAPTIQSDLPDYAPGETVVLTGQNWQPGESVHIYVNDDEGQTWNRNVDVTADENGAIRDEFQLPNHFVATYSVKATGASGAVATSSFTDGNVTSATIAVRNNTCATAQTSFPSGSTVCARINAVLQAGGATTSWRFKWFAPGVSISAGTPVRDTLYIDPGSATTATHDDTFAPSIAGTWTLVVCKTGNAGGCSSGNQVQTATFTVTAPTNQVPTANAGGPYTVNEGGSVQLSGSGSDSDGTINSYAWDLDNNGSFETSGQNPNFSAASIDGPASRTVVLRVTDNSGATATSNASVTINNVAPTVTLASTNDLSVAEGSTQHTYSYTISDPGVDTISSVTTSCGTGGVKVAVSDTNTNTSGSFKCTFADGPASPSVSAQATDSDGDAGNTATQSVTVNNVAPTVTLSGDATADEGQTKTYTYTVSDPGNDTYTVDENCGANGTKTDTAASNSFDCTFPDGPASSTVSAQATDSYNAAGNTATQSVTVANVAPNVTLDPNNDQSVDEGTTHTYSYTVSDPGNDTFTVSAGYPNCGTGGNLVAGSAVTSTSGGSFKCSFPDGPAQTNVAIKVADSDGSSDTASEAVQIVAVANVAPSVTAPADQSSNEGENHAFDLGSFTDPGPDSPWTVDVDWGDGSTHGSASKSATGSLGTMSHTYADNGNYTVTVKVTDKNGGVDSKTFQVTVNNVAPTVTLAAGNDLTVDEGSAEHTYNYSISDPGADTVSSVSTSCGANGTKVAGSDTNTNTSGSFKCTFADGPASSTVSAQATDSDSAAGNTAEQSVTVNNVKPSVALSGAATADEGQTKTYTYTVSDPGNDTYTATEACGTNGTKTDTAAANSFDCTFPDGPATTDVTVKVTDSDGATDTDNQVVTVTVSNVPPVVTAAANQSASEGTSTNFNLGSFTDPGDDASWEVSVDWGDNSAPTTFQVNAAGSLGSRSHTYTDNGNYTVTVAVTEAGTDPASGSATFQADVANVAPAVTAAANQTSNEGLNKLFNLGSFADPGDDGPWEVSVDWGDNSAPTTFQVNAAGSLGSRSHTYADNGNYTVTVTVAEAGGTPSDFETFQVAVANVNPTIGPLTVTGNSATACLGSTNVVKLSFSITDPGVEDTHSGTINWGDGTTTQFNGSSVTDAQHSYSAGTYNITVNASDNDGGNAAPKSTTTANQVSLLYKVSLLQDPVNVPSATTPMSVFKSGSVIPLKVIITDCNNQPVNGLVPRISFTNVSKATPTIAPNEAVSIQPNDTNFLMRDAGNGQYIYNLSTKSLPDPDATYNATIRDSKTPATYGPKDSQNFGVRSK